MRAQVELGSITFVVFCFPGWRTHQALPDDPLHKLQTLIQRMGKKVPRQDPTGQPTLKSKKKDRKWHKQRRQVRRTWNGGSHFLDWDAKGLNLADNVR